MGDTGPCGPCSEIMIDQGPEFGALGRIAAPGCDCDRYLEIWNLVFMQFNRDAEGRLNPLPKPSIDTGMGLERFTAVLQGASNNFLVTSSVPSSNPLRRCPGSPSDGSRTWMWPSRLLPTIAGPWPFYWATGSCLSNEGRGYVVRRILRRAARHGKVLGFNQPFLSRLAQVVAETMGELYPEVHDNLVLDRPGDSIRRKNVSCRNP